MRKALYILGQLNDLDVEWMIANGHRDLVRRGEVLIRQGIAIDSVYILLSGLFQVVDDRGGGRELARLGSGEIVGEMSFIDLRPPVATVSAVEDGVVLGIPKPALRQKLESDTGFAARFYRALAIFLSDRMRATLGVHSGRSSPGGVDEGAEQDDELDLNVMDTVHLAGARFDQILKRLSGA
jgi:CRP/FNR family transcriptional regulator, cyclic AMP receptor protein